MMENGFIASRPFSNGFGGGIPPNSTLSNFKPVQKEPIVLLSGKNRGLEQSRPDIKTFGFRPIAQADPILDDTGRDYYLDSDLETIAEESSVLESDFDERSTPCNGSTVIGDYDRADGDQSTPTLSSSSSSLYSQTSNLNPASSKPNHANHAAQNSIVYAKCLSPEGYHPTREEILTQPSTTVVSHRQPANEASAIQYVDGYLNGLPDTASSPSISLRSDSTMSQREDELTMTDMFNAVTRGDLRTLRRFSVTEQNETVDERGNTILHLAATAGQLQSIQFLMGGPLADVISLPNDELMTPTALAVMRGHLACVRWMVENTSARKELIASSRQASIDGSSMRPPLPHVAARYNQDQVLDYLCEQLAKENCSVDSADYHSNTATHEAAAQGHLKALQVLVGKGASVTVLNSNGDTPGQVADKNGMDLCVGYLVVVETCMSLAQQLIRVKLENEGLVKDNANLKSQVQALNEAKLTAARQSVEERIKATLQGISSCDEDEDSIVSQKRPSLPKDTVDGGVPVTPQSTDANLPSKTLHSPKTRQIAKDASQLHDPVQISGTVKTRHNTHQDPVNIARSTQPEMVADESKPMRFPQSMGPRQLEHRTERTTLVPNQAPVQDEQRVSTTKKDRSTKPNPTSTSDEVAAVSASMQGAKAWEIMAMDEVLRLARDSRYLPSPTISVRTEDSTMESKEVLRDRMAEASRWFLVQQAGGKAHLKDSKVSQRMRQTANTFLRPKHHQSAHKPRPMVGPIPQGTKSGPMPARIIPTSSVNLSHQTMNSTRQQLRPNASHSASTVANDEDQHSNTGKHRTATYRSNQIGSIASIRPSSAKSSISNASTIRANDSTSSSPSTLSGNSVIENTTRDSNLQPQTPDNDRKKQSSSPASSARSSIGKYSPNHTKSQVYSSRDINSSAAQVTVPIPARHSSFLRKVQPPSPTIGRGKSPARSNHATSSGVQTAIDAKQNSVSNSQSTNRTAQTHNKKENFNSFAYFVPRTTPKDTKHQEADRTPTLDTSSRGNVNNNKSYFSNSRSAPVKRKKMTKIFRF